MQLSLYPPLCRYFLSVFVLFFGLSVSSVRADDHSSTDHSSKKELHFSRPLVTIYPTVENEIRVSHTFENKAFDEGVENELEAELEYEFIDDIAFEIEVPFVFTNPSDGDSEQAFGNVEAGLKFANHALSQYRIGMAYGFVFSLPTGDEDKGIGSDELVKFEPFYSFGYKLRRFEAIASTKFEVPLNSENDEEDEIELVYATSLLYRLPHDSKIFVEFDGELALNGDEQGEPVVNISPGFKVEPVDDLEFALSVGFPLTDEREFNTRAIATVFWEF